MKNLYVALYICLLLSSLATKAQQQNTEKEKILSRMTSLYNTMLNQTGEGYFIKLDSLFLLERHLFKNTPCPDLQFTVFINPSRAVEIIKKAQNKEELCERLLKYQYDTAFTVNNALYSLYQNLRENSKDSLSKQRFTSCMLDFQVNPRVYWTDHDEANDNAIYYNQEGIDKLIRIVGKHYTDKEKAAYALYLMKCDNKEQVIYFKLESKYSKELYRTEPDKAKREKKLKEITPELVKQHYPELYRHISDSLIRLYSVKASEHLYRIDVSRLIYVLGKVYAKSSITVLKEIYKDTLYHNERERYMASAALSRLGVLEYEDLFLTDKQPKAGALVYICSQKSIYRFAELMKDTTQKTGCFAWDWEIIGKEYKDLKIPTAYKYLWMLKNIGVIKSFPIEFDYKYDDYCLLYGFSKNKEHVLKITIQWLEEHKGKYELNLYYPGYDYDLDY